MIIFLRWNKPETITNTTLFTFLNHHYQNPKHYLFHLFVNNVNIYKTIYIFIFIYYFIFYIIIKSIKCIIKYIYFIFIILQLSFLSFQDLTIFRSFPNRKYFFLHYYYNYFLIFLQYQFVFKPSSYNFVNPPMMNNLRYLI